MGKKCYYLGTVILLVILISTGSGLSDISIYPDMLYQNTPLVITYQGFSDGDSLDLYFTAESASSISDVSGFGKSFLVHPFRLNQGKITAVNGTLSVNDLQYPSGEYSGLNSGLVSLSVLVHSETPADLNSVSFRVSGKKSSGAENGTLTFLPEFSPKVGNLTVSGFIGNQTVHKFIPYNQLLPKVQPEQVISTNPLSEMNNSYGYMLLNSDKIRTEMMEDIKIPRTSDSSISAASQSVSLLSYVPYNAFERDQGNCGNCWAWASTGVIEVAHHIQNDVSDRLSIQYLNSNLNNGTGDDWACNGGSAANFATFYSNISYDQAIPWSNTNASFADANACPDGDCSGGTKIPSTYISENPKYPISSISSAMVSTQDVTQAQAIANLETILDHNNAIYYGFTLPNSSAWTQFGSFWSGQNESAIWDPDPYNNISEGTGAGGHGVLLVGYNSTSLDENERYWEVLNSWSNTTLRPNGVFRLKMNMNYAGSNFEYYNHRFYTLNVTYGNVTESYNITSSSGPGGIISPSGVIQVTKGTNQTFTITPNSGYLVQDVIIDNMSAGAITSYTFSNVTEDHIIGANFSVVYPQQWYINATAGTGGSISPSGQVSVFERGNKSFEITSLPNYSIADVIINNSVNLGSQTSPFVYTFSNVTSNQSINTRFSEISGTHTINSSSNQWSKINPAGTYSYPKNSNKSYIMQAKPGSTLTNLSVDETLYDQPTGNWTFTNLTKNHSLRVNGTPIPGQVQVFFDASPRHGPAPLTVVFSDQSLGSPTSYYWQFGDGTSDTVSVPTHIYTVPGVYTVTMRAVNNQSGGYGIWTKFITVTNGYEPEPTPTPVPGQITASFEVSPQTGTTPLDVHFTDKSSGNPISWIWDFGDGQISTLQDVTHRYTNPGSYTVTLLAQNRDYSGSITRPDLVTVQ